MDAKQVNQSFDLVSYVSGIVKLRKSGAYFIGACPICGGRDRFQVKRADGDLWICRKCKPDKYHSALDFLMDFHKESFVDALKRAGGDTQPPRRPIGTPQPVTTPAPVQVLPGETWQADAWRFVDKASSRLMDESGEAGRRYLLSRGIDRGMIFDNLLGFAVIGGKRPAVVIPYLDAGDIITAVKYRFIDDLAKQDKTKRFAMMTGSKPYLFGLQHVLNTDKTLLFVEGELNAVSVLQTRPHGVSVVSTGGETNGHAAILRALASHYSRVVIWMDDPSKARTKREQMNRPEAHLLKSPVIEGVKYDANQMLQAGLLNDFISAQLQTQTERWTIDPDVIKYTGAKVAQEASAAGGG